MKKFFSVYFPLIAYLLLIFIMSSTNIRSTPLTQGSLSYLMHGLEFFILAVLLLRVFYDSKNPYLYTFIVSFLFALSDEFHQFFVQGRTASMFDLAADAVGISLILVFKNKLLQKIIRP